MNLKLANGVNIIVKEVEGNKVVIFDRSVRLVALEPQEARQVGVSLYRAKKGTVFPHLQKLIDSGFLDIPRSFTEIRQRLSSTNHVLRPSSLMMVLQSFLDKAVLSRTGKQGDYRYVKA